MRKIKLKTKTSLLSNFEQELVFFTLSFFSYSLFYIFISIWKV